MAHQGGARAGGAWSGGRREQRGAHAAGAGSGRQGASFLTKSLIALGVAGLLGGAAVAANAGLRPRPVQQAVPDNTGLGDPALTPSSVPAPAPSPTTKPADPPSPGPAAPSTGSAPAKTTAPAKVRAPAKPAPPDTANPPVAPNAAG